MVLQQIDPGVTALLTEKQQMLVPYTEGLTIIEGRKGTGKTTLAVALAWYLREEFGIPVVSDFPLLPAFGDYSLFDLKTFVRNLKTIASATKGAGIEVAKRDLDALIEKGRMPKIIGASVIFDEAYEWLESRTPHDPVVILLTHWFSQMRHYQCSIFLITPALHMIDKRVRLQMDRHIRCSTEIGEEGKRVTYGMGDDIGQDEELDIEVDAERFQGMFNSWILRPIRSAMLRKASDQDDQDTKALAEPLPENEDLTGDPESEANAN